ncbi:MAG: DUF2807 domain-containing protein [Bacteroidetes bacterium]|nr:DUF2807 domain-containing protein [Bacteroidota bacterium]
MKKISRHIFLLLTLTSLFLICCKKPADRSCFKSTGDQTSVEIPLDSVHTFNLYKNIRYRIFQDNSRKLVVKGGANVVNLIEAKNENGVVSVSNKNKCNFLRKSEDLVEVEIHYPYLNHFYIEPSDSVIFENTITGDSLWIQMREGGGSARLDVNVNFLSINVSYGTGDYVLSGYANNAEVKIQNNGFADASQFNSPYVFVYNNSTGDLKINLENAYAFVVLEGTGEIYYTGQPDSLSLVQPGSGELIKL